MTSPRKPEGERIQKVLANAGLGSRREIEGWIREGRIQVNGRAAIPGDRIGHRDKVRIDGREIRLEKAAPDKTRVLAYYKRGSLQPP